MLEHTITRRKRRPRYYRRVHNAYRARRKRGEFVARVEITNDIVNLLIDLRWLSIERSEDRVAIARAIRALLEDVAIHGLTQRR